MFGSLSEKRSGKIDKEECLMFNLQKLNFPSICALQKHKRYATNPAPVPICRLQKVVKKHQRCRCLSSCPMPHQNSLKMQTNLNLKEHTWGKQTVRGKRFLNVSLGKFKMYEYTEYWDNKALLWSQQQASCSDSCEPGSSVQLLLLLLAALTLSSPHRSIAPAKHLPDHSWLLRHVLQ